MAAGLGPPWRAEAYVAADMVGVRAAYRLQSCPVCVSVAVCLW
eukprot:COSAG02_NODE_18593_length_930_cov_1.265945_1_plen_42_part_10